MRVIILFLATVLIGSLTACNNSSGAATFCDTTCNSDSIQFRGSDNVNSLVAINVKNCQADSLFWAHDYVGSKQLDLSEYLGQEVKLNKKAIDCYFADTAYAWLQFNDCVTGRGYLLKLPFNKRDDRQKITGALTRFDPKFAIDADLIAYTDRGSVFVENLKTAKKATMSFDKSYDIDFAKIHETVDSANITKDRIFVQMIRDGQPKTYEKKISL